MAGVVKTMGRTDAQGGKAVGNFDCERGDCWKGRPSLESSMDGIGRWRGWSWAKASMARSTVGSMQCLQVKVSVSGARVGQRIRTGGNADRQTMTGKV